MVGACFRGHLFNNINNLGWGLIQVGRFFEGLLIQDSWYWQILLSFLKIYFMV